MDKHDAAELIRKFGKLIDDCKQEIHTRSNAPTWLAPAHGKRIPYMEGEIGGLRNAIKVTQDSVSESEKLTVAEALQIGGWFYFVGTISGIYATAVTGAHYIYIPKPIDQTADPVIPFWGEWLQPHRFTGDWYGPISPPV